VSPEAVLSNEATWFVNSAHSEDASEWGCCFEPPSRAREISSCDITRRIIMLSPQYLKKMMWRLGFGWWKASVMRERCHSWVTINLEEHGEYEIML
jgi:hypothetical protein